MHFLKYFRHFQHNNRRILYSLCVNIFSYIQTIQQFYCIIYQYRSETHKKLMKLIRKSDVITKHIRSRLKVSILKFALCLRYCYQFFCCCKLMLVQWCLKNVLEEEDKCWKFTITFNYYPISLTACAWISAWHGPHSDINAPKHAQIVEGSELRDINC